MWPFLVAQEIAPLPGVSGWVGAGLLGAVLSWLLLKHLPEKDAQLERILDRHRAELATALTQQRADSMAALQRILAQHETQLAMLNKEFEAIRQALVQRSIT